jgi:hypothetical protein
MRVETRDRHRPRRRSPDLPGAVADFFNRIRPKPPSHSGWCCTNWRRTPPSTGPSPPARVTIAWSDEDRAGEPRFVLRWSESGGPKPDLAPTRQGFGSELIERLIRHDLGGTVELTFGDAGLLAVLTLPANVVAEIGRKPLQPGRRED